MKYLLVLILILGIVIALWSNAGDAAIIAAAGRVYVLLENQPEVQKDVMSTIIKARNTWIPVFWLGISVAGSALFGFKLLRRKPSQ